MDIIRRSILVIFFLVFPFSTQNYFTLGLGIMNNIMICKPSERRALLSIKQHLKNSSNSLSSWSGENCCRWAGVVCSNTTDHVVQLQLHDLGLGGKLNPSLQELKQLRHLDLSFNQFEGISIPDFLGSLQSLRYLNLSNAGFGGMIPHQLGKLSNLRYLDLSDCPIYQFRNNFSSLEQLDLDRLNASSNLFGVVNMLPSLLVLRLSGCHLSGALLPTSLTSSLAVLDLSRNNFNSTLPEWLYSLTNLEHLDLSQNYFGGTISPSIGNLTKLTLLNLIANQLEGEIPTAIGNLCKLRTLDLSWNKLSGPLPDQLGRLENLDHLSLWFNSFSGSIPFSIGRLTLLTFLDLGENSFSGPIPFSIGRLTLLTFLDLSENSFSGPIPFSIGRLTLLRLLDLSENKLNGSVPESFGNLSKLQTLILSPNSLEGNVSGGLDLQTLTSLQQIQLDSVVLKVSPEWIPPFQLTIAGLRNCGLGPRFPNWIQTQKGLAQLDLSSNGISGSVPTWFWNLSSQFTYLNLSHNHFNGELPKVLEASYIIDLSSNQFKGSLPQLSFNVDEVDLSNNFFSGNISALVCNPVVNDLRVLDLSNNLLSGDLSPCWFYWSTLISVRLGSNNITGKIPSSMGSLLELQSLHLQNNNLYGELPLSLRNCTSLVTLDIGENVLGGRLPIWLGGESFPNLIVLRLRGNKFYSEIPQELCDMTSLQMLDLAHNNLSGSIPRCFNNFTAMATKQNSSIPIAYDSSKYGEMESLGTKGREFEYRTLKPVESLETTSLVMKGREFEYSKTLTLVTSMDLSKNSLSGDIPEELTSLIGLRFLNLSENRFTGKIPDKIGNMSLLESLDFSNNNISGVIPQSISDISSLSYLNLSYNNLSGKIPLGTQLQGFNESSFIGNQELCGLPLKNCIGEKPPQEPPGDHIGDREDEDEDWFEMKWFYMSMGVGFVLGFWAFCGVLVFKKSWRFAYFRFLDDMKDKICLLF